RDQPRDRRRFGDLRRHREVPRQQHPAKAPRGEPRGGCLSLSATARHAHSMTGTTSESERHLVVFTLHDEQYARPVTTAREIIRYVAPSATATASGLIRGMISLRGQVLPIVDLSIKLGRNLEIADGTRILAVELEHGSVGLIVDRVDGVRLIPVER